MAVVVRVQGSVWPQSVALVFRGSESFVASFVASFVGSLVDKARDKAHDKGPLRGVLRDKYGLVSKLRFCRELNIQYPTLKSNVQGSERGENDMLMVLSFAHLSHLGVGYSLLDIGC